MYVLSGKVLFLLVQQVCMISAEGCKTMDSLQILNCRTNCELQIGFLLRQEKNIALQMDPVGFYPSEITQIRLCYNVFVLLFK